MFPLLSKLQSFSCLLLLPDFKIRQGLDHREKRCPEQIVRVIAASPEAKTLVEPDGASEKRRGAQRQALVPMVSSETLDLPQQHFSDR